MKRADDVTGMEDYQDETSSIEEEHAVTPFQQELRSHLLAIQKKLDAMSKRMEIVRPSITIGAKARGSNVRPQSSNVRPQSRRSHNSDDSSSLGSAIIGPTHSVPVDEPLDAEPHESGSPKQRRSSAPPKTGVDTSKKKRKSGWRSQRSEPSHTVHNLDFVLPNSTADSTAANRAPGDRPYQVLVKNPGTTMVAQELAPPIPHDDSGPTENADQGVNSMVPSSQGGEGGDEGETEDRSPSKQTTERQNTNMTPRTGRTTALPELRHQNSVISGERMNLGRLRSWLNLNDSTPGGGRRASILDHTGVNHMVSNAHEFISRKWTETRDRRLYQLVHGVHFQLLSSFMIALNVAMIGVIADARLHHGLNRTPEPPVWDYIEIGFCTFFGLELLLRGVSERILFIFGPEWRWNLFDFFLVLFSVADIILNRINSLTISNVTAARILRFVRFIRVIRIARAVRAFHSLRIVCFAIIESMASLVWCFLVVGLIIYMFAIVFLYGVTEHLRDSDGTHQVTSDLLEYYGDVPTAVLSLFMTISGGVDWHDAMRPLKAVHWIYQPLFAFYVFLMVIGVLNVVMGAFVAATAEISKRDRDALVKAEMDEQQAYTRKIKTFFNEADKDRSGLLSWGEFKEHLKIPKVSAYFRALELDVSQAHVLFKLLDRDGSNEVSLDEFLAGCQRLKGQAKSLEVNMLLYENKRLFNRITDFMEVLVEHIMPNNAMDDTLSGEDSRPVLSPPSPFIDE